MSNILKRDIKNERKSGGKILLSYIKYLSNGDIIFANIIDDDRGVIMTSILPNGERLEVGFIGANPENVLKKKEDYKRSIIMHFKRKGYNIKLKG